MPDFARYGLALAFLIAAGVALLFLAFAPTAHTPHADQMTGEVRINPVQHTPYTPTVEKVTANA